MADRRRRERRRQEQGVGAERRKADRRKGDRRTDARVPAELMVQVDNNGRRTYRRTADISLGGAGFASPLPYRLGARLRVGLQLPGQSQSLSLDGEVVGVSKAGLGTRVRFVDLTQTRRTQLERHLDVFSVPTSIRARSRGRSRSREGNEARVREGILIVCGDPEGREFRLRTDDRVIGRDPDEVDCVLGHYSVSRRHAHVYLHNDRHVLADLGSTNGTHFKNESVHTMVLKDGMIFRIGKVRVQYLVTRAV